CDGERVKIFVQRRRQASLPHQHATPFLGRQRRIARLCLDHGLHYSEHDDTGYRAQEHDGPPHHATSALATDTTPTVAQAYSRALRLPTCPSIAAADWWAILPVRCSGRAPLGLYFWDPSVTRPGKAPAQPAVPSICASRGLLGSSVTPALQRGVPRCNPCPCGAFVLVPL